MMIKIMLKMCMFVAFILIVSIFFVAFVSAADYNITYSTTKQYYSSTNSFGGAVTQLNTGALLFSFADSSNSNYGTLVSCNKVGESCSVISTFYEDWMSYSDIKQLTNNSIYIAHGGRNTDKSYLTMCDSVGSGCVSTQFSNDEPRYAQIIQSPSGQVIVSYVDDDSPYYGHYAFYNSGYNNFTIKNFIEDVVSGGDMGSIQLINGSFLSAFTMFNWSTYDEHLALTICNSSGESCNITKYGNIYTSAVKPLQLSNGNILVSYINTDTDYLDMMIFNSSMDNLKNVTVNPSTSSGNINLLQLNDTRLGISFINGSYSTILVCNTTGENCISHVINDASFDVDENGMLQTQQGELILLDDSIPYLSITNSLINTTPEFVQQNFTREHIWSANLLMKINATDANNDSINFSINNTKFDINSSGWINASFTTSDYGLINITITVSDGDTNDTMWILFNITNTAPTTSSVSINPAPAEVSDNLTCIYTFNDTDGDSEVEHWFNWTINGVLSDEHNVTLTYGNTSTNDNITCSVKVNDGVSNSTWYTSPIKNIGDTISPTLSNFGISEDVGYTSDIITITADCYDGSSFLAADFPKVSFIDPANNTIGNFTMSLLVANTYKKDYIFSTVGTYDTFKFYCDDSSGNSASQSVPSITFTAGIKETTGGGGGSTEITIIEGTNITCGNGICDPLEDRFSCPVDCKPTATAIGLEDLRENPVLTAFIVLIIVGFLATTDILNIKGGNLVIFGQKIPLGGRRR